jgi:hypothetical protein
MTSQRPSVLTNRTALVCALAFCVYQALPRSMTTLSSFKAVNDRDPLFFVWAAIATFIATSIAVRSWFLGDRVVFGVAAGAFVISVVRRLVSPSPSIDLVLGGLDSLAWASAAVTCLVLVLSGWRKRTA